MNALGMRRLAAVAPVAATVGKVGAPQRTTVRAISEGLPSNQSHHQQQQQRRQRSASSPLTHSAALHSYDVARSSSAHTFAAAPCGCSRSTPSSSAVAAVAPEAAAAAETPTMPEKLKAIVKSFQAVPDPRARYQQLLFYASKLPALPKELQTPENKVTGCVSQVWVVPRFDETEGRMYFRADSDSQLTKGLAALLVEGLSGAKAAEILLVTPDFITQLGLRQSLTPSRNNGFLNMLRLMQKRTIDLVAASASTGAVASSSSSASSEAAASTTEEAPASAASDATPGGAGAAPVVSEVASNGSAASAAEESSSSGRPIADGIRRKLTALLQPVVLDIEDVSHQHAGHAHMMTANKGKAGGSGETHFNVRVVSPAFEGASTVKRHRMIYEALQEEFNKGLHALSLVTRTPSEGL